MLNKNCKVMSCIDCTNDNFDPEGCNLDKFSIFSGKYKHVLILYCVDPIIITIYHNDIFSKVTLESVILKVLEEYND